MLFVGLIMAPNKTIPDPEIGLDDLVIPTGVTRLTARTQRLLMLNDRQEAQAFVELHKGFPLKRQASNKCPYAVTAPTQCLRSQSLDALPNV